MDGCIDLENAELPSDNWPESSLDAQSDGESDSQVNRVPGERADIVREILPEYDPAHAKEIKCAEPTYVPEIEYEILPERDPAHAEEIEYAEPTYVRARD